MAMGSKVKSPVVAIWYHIDKSLESEEVKQLRDFLSRLSPNCMEYANITEEDMLRKLNEDKLFFFLLSTTNKLVTNDNKRSFVYRVDVNQIMFEVTGHTIQLFKEIILAMNCSLGAHRFLKDLGYRRELIGIKHISNFGDVQVNPRDIVCVQGYILGPFLLGGSVFVRLKSVAHREANKPVLNLLITWMEIFNVSRSLRLLSRTHNFQHLVFVAEKNGQCTAADLRIKQEVFEKCGIWQLKYPSLIGEMYDTFEYEADLETRLAEQLGRTSIPKNP